jgi:dUTP pyrophosphatase
MIVKPLNDRAFKLSKRTKGSAAYDIHCSVETVILSGCTRVIETDLYIDSMDIASLVLSRSSLSVNGIWVANAPGLIDPDYKGPLQVIMYNSTRNDYTVARGARIAQLMPMSKTAVIAGFAEVLDDTRAGGLGSTGV